MDYKIIRSSRKTVYIQVTPKGEVLVRCPQRLTKEQIQQCVDSKRDWIEAYLQKIASRPAQPKLTQQELKALAKQAAKDLSERTARFAPLVGVSYGRITIRAQHTRWGSCSGKGNLNFNCLLMLTPLEVWDYIIVHELCHRKQMNHSPAFWAEVEAVLPNYRELKKWLNENGNVLIARLP